MRSFMIRPAHQILFWDQIKEVTMGRACGNCAHMWAKRSAFRDLVEKTWGKENKWKNKA